RRVHEEKNMEQTHIHEAPYDPADEWGRPPEVAIDHLPFVPLTAPGMPPPGPDFVRVATAWGDPPPQVLRIGGLEGCHDRRPRPAAAVQEGTLCPDLRPRGEYGPRPKDRRVHPWPSVGLARVGRPDESAGDGDRRHAHQRGRELVPPLPPQRQGGPTLA